MTVMYTGEQLMAEIAKLHQLGGEFATCPGPNRFEVNDTQDYVIKWDNVGIPSLSMNEQVPLDQIISGYKNIYTILFAPKYCGTVVPEPEQPGPSLAIRAAFNAWQIARATEQRLLDEYVKLAYP